MAPCGPAGEIWLWACRAPVMLGRILPILAAGVPAGSADPGGRRLGLWGGYLLRTHHPLRSPSREAAYAERCALKSPLRACLRATATAHTASGALAGDPQQTGGCRGTPSACCRVRSNCVPSSRQLGCPSCFVRPAARPCLAASRSAMSRLRCAWERSTATQVSARNSASSSTRPQLGSLFRRTVWSAFRVRSVAERGSLAQPAQRARLTAALAPARQHLV